MSDTVVLTDADGNILTNDDGSSILIASLGTIQQFSSLFGMNHLAYDGLPWFFFGLTDRDTGQVFYVCLNHETGHISLFDRVPRSATGPIISRIHVYPAFQGPGIAQTSLQLGVRGGRLLFEESTKQFSPLFPTMAFDTWGFLTQAALFMGANLFGPWGIADQLPDHVAYNIVDPVIDECSNHNPIDVLTNDDGDFVLGVDDNEGILTGQ